jgi:hypothetical protein
MEFHEIFHKISWKKFHEKNPSNVYETFHEIPWNSMKFFYGIPWDCMEFSVKFHGKFHGIS